MSSPTVETLKFQHDGVAYVATFDSRDADQLRRQLQSGQHPNVLFQYDLQIKRVDGERISPPAAGGAATAFLCELLNHCNGPRPTLH